ncbi:LysR family transcriptional regulator [Frankia sp. CN6]|uniref:LysR family transcriptional regulator n=1 Tax=Frankia nepalensis TaxID=1836974 RepID=A0A937RDE4_9ACTN|nr:LysR family transcriptional regulator [Frankia nepalensis]
MLLRTFTTVARAGSFSVAARELGYTQSAVSQQIAALEASLGGVALLTRRPVTPTSAGTRLLEHAEPLLLRAAAARADVLRAAGGPPDHLRVAACPLAMPRLAAAFARATAAMPRLDVTISVVARDEVATAVARGACELGLAVGLAVPGDPLRLPDTGPLRAVGIATEPVCVALPADHPLAGRAGLRLADLDAARWLDAPDAAAPAADLRRATGAEDLIHCARYLGTDLAGLVALVAVGAGLTLLPAWAVADHPAVAAVPVTAPQIEYRTELLSGVTADNGSAGRALAAFLGA